MRFVPMDNRNLNFLYGYALSREAGKLVDAYNPKKLIRTVFKFAAKRLAFYTDDQLSAAVDYCLFGADWTVCERAKSEELRAGVDSAFAARHFSARTVAYPPENPRVYRHHVRPITVAVPPVTTYFVSRRTRLSSFAFASSPSIGV